MRKLSHKHPNLSSYPKYFITEPAPTAHAVNPLPKDQSTPPRKAADVCAASLPASAGCVSKGPPLPIYPLHQRDVQPTTQCGGSFFQCGEGGRFGIGIEQPIHCGAAGTHAVRHFCLR